MKYFYLFIFFFCMNNCDIKLKLFKFVCVIATVTEILILYMSIIYCSRSKHRRLVRQRFRVQFPWSSESYSANSVIKKSREL